MTWKQHVTDEQYDDSSNRFDADDVAEGRLHTVQWNDLLTEATTLTHLKETGRDFIEINLGYLPPEEVMLPFEPYLRALIQLYWQNSIAEDNFRQLARDHIKLIRNADMGHNTCKHYDEAIYQNYHGTYVPYGYAIKDRLTRFLGYTPKLEHSLIAEMWLRTIKADETYIMPEEMTPDDIRAMTLIKYREVLLKEGKTEADQSPVLTDLI